MNRYTLITLAVLMMLCKASSLTATSQSASRSDVNENTVVLPDEVHEAISLLISHVENEDATANLLSYYYSDSQHQAIALDVAQEVVHEALQLTEQLANKLDENVVKNLHNVLNAYQASLTARGCNPCACPCPLDPCPTVFMCTGPVCPKNIYRNMVRRLCIEECLKVGELSWFKEKVTIGCEDVPTDCPTGCPNAILCVNGDVCIRGDVCIGGTLFATGLVGPSGPPGLPLLNFVIEDNLVQTAVATGEDAIAVGKNSVSSGFKSIALGNIAQATNTTAIAIGTEAVANGVNSIAVGLICEARENAIVFSTGGSIADDNCIVIGGFADNSDSSICVGSTDTDAANTVFGIAIGAGTVVNGDYASAIGSGITDAAGDRTVAIGSNAEAGFAGLPNEDLALVVGSSSNAGGEGSIVIGSQTTTGSILNLGPRGIAIGYQSQVDPTNTFPRCQAIGTRLSNDITDSLLLGSDATIQFFSRPFARFENAVSVQQIISNSTGVTIDASQGYIEMFEPIPALSPTVEFVVTNNRVAADSVILLSSGISNGTSNATPVSVASSGAGTFTINVNNVSGTEVGSDEANRRIYFLILNPAL